MLRHVEIVITSALILAVTTTMCNAATIFTVAEEIGLSQFGSPYSNDAKSIQLSPDGNYLAVDTERGSLKANLLEDTLRIYRVDGLRNFLHDPQGLAKLFPMWTVGRTGAKGPVIKQWRWMPDSNGIAYAENGPRNIERLMLADLKRRRVEFLTPESENVTGFDIRDRTHFVYAVSTANLYEKEDVGAKPAEVVGTGLAIDNLLWSPRDRPLWFSDRSVLWAVTNGQRRQVNDRVTGEPIILFSEGTQKLALSPDGRWLVTALAVATVPQKWELLYPPPFATSPIRIRAGRQDLESVLSGSSLVSQFSRIDLRDGTIESLTDAPTASSLNSGWLYDEARPSWSNDGQALLLPKTFIRSSTDSPSNPCVAVWDSHLKLTTCVETLKATTASGAGSGYDAIYDTRFVGEDSKGVRINFYKPNKPAEESWGSREYERLNDKSWSLKKETTMGEASAINMDGESVVLALNGGLEISVKQGLNDPPKLVATEVQSGITKLLLDPNPVLHSTEIGEARPLNWTDKAGRNWSGGLYLPPNYVRGRRYPVVIQNHGFLNTKFLPSGIFPTAFAARALAAAGIVVIQVGSITCSGKAGTIDEAPCNVAGYEAIVDKLTKDGLADPARVGIVGFSRTCYYVMQALVGSSLRFRAAAVTDGVMYDYFQYLTQADEVTTDADLMNGGPPFGPGLQQWFAHSPLFNIDKVKTPLMVVGLGTRSLLFMWGPYAALRYLHKPVDLIMLNSDEHVLTNPSERMASQGGSVDWFRFWLQGYEDPDPSKLDQYRRWEGLCDLQRAGNPTGPAFCVPTKS